MLPVGAGQIVYTKDGYRLGLVETVADKAFKVAANADHPDYWLRREAVARVTYGGVLYGSILTAR